MNSSLCKEIRSSYKYLRIAQHYRRLHPPTQTTRYPKAFVRNSFRYPKFTSIATFVRRSELSALQIQTIVKHLARLPRIYTFAEEFRTRIRPIRGKISFRDLISEPVASAHQRRVYFQSNPLAIARNISVL